MKPSTKFGAIRNAKKSIEKIIDFRNKNGRFNSRNELIDNKILSAKVYEQSIGFMRVLDGSNPLDKTSIHPESYDKTTKLLESIGMNYDSLGTEELISKLDNTKMFNLDNGLNVGDNVVHDSYGPGVVVMVDKSIATIAFKGVGIKKLMKNHKSIHKM